jgi:hypothetical protein
VRSQFGYWVGSDGSEVGDEYIEWQIIIDEEADE